MQGRLIGGRYQVVRKIAEGGMGAVYEAQHNLSKKTVALKVLLPHIGRDEAARQRFLREVSAPAQIGHDGIVEVYDAGFDTQDGSLFVAMEMLRGETLRDRLARGGHARDVVLDWFERMLEALAAAHAKGIVHRDLKPENVFLHTARDGREIVKILDFGIARDLDERSHHVTQTGIAMGTPHYMAPEQAMSARDVSFPADVWAVGVMLYEALGGRMPFEGETPSAVIVQALSRPHRPLAETAPGTPAALAALVDRCLDKDPAARPRDAGQLLHELRLARGRSPSASLPGPASSRPHPSAITAHVAPHVTSSPTAPPHHASPVPTPRGPTSGPVTAGNATAPSLGSVPAAMATPAPLERSQAPRSERAIGRWLALFAVLGVLGVLALSAVGVAVYFLVTTAPSAATGVGTLRVQTMVPGDLYVDGQARGPVLLGGQDLEVAAGRHLVEIRQAGATVASGEIEVAAGRLAQIELVRGAFATTETGTGVGASRGVVHGTLEPGDPTLRSGEYVDAYTYQWSAGERVHLELVSSAFDPYLILWFPSGAQRDNDDGPGMGRNAMIDETLPETGTYRVLVTSYRPGETGPYTLTIR